MMSLSHDEPTREMFSFFESRTKEHIGRVAKCLELLAEAVMYPEELRQRAKTHDASKFETEERTPYIWLTEFHRCRSAGEVFKYPLGMEAKVKEAVKHHVTSNRHHYEFHQDPNAMSEVDLIEMVCDWTAMAQEFNQNGGSSKGWASEIIGKRVIFNIEKQQFIYKVIEKLDREVARSQ